MTNLSSQYLPLESEFRQLQVIANTAMQSQLYAGVGSEQKIFCILLAARELGIPPMQALNGGLWNIKGRVELSPRLMSAMIRRAGHSIDIVSLNDEECTLVGKRGDNGDTHTAKFSMEDARRAGLAGKDAWKTYADDMLYNRAMSRLGRRLFADVIGTAYIEGEISGAPKEDKESKIEQLPVEAVEEITQTIPIGKLDSLIVLFDMCEDLYKEKMLDWLKKKGVQSLKSLPQKYFDGIKTSVDAHLAEITEKLARTVGES